MDEADITKVVEVLPIRQKEAIPHLLAVLAEEALVNDDQADNENLEFFSRNQRAISRHILA